MGTYSAMTVTYSAYQSPTPGDRCGNITGSISRLTGTCDVDMGVLIYEAYVPYVTVTINSETGRN